MPNWHFNEWDITSNEPSKLTAAIDLLFFKDENGEPVMSFEKVAPMPDILENTIAGTVSTKERTAYHDDPEDYSSHRMATDEEMEKIRATGHLNWYDWQCANWSVKWGPSSDTLHRWGETGVTIEFQTPWGPPTEFLKKYVKRLKEDGLFDDISLECRSHGEDIWDIDYSSDDDED